MLKIHYLLNIRAKRLMGALLLLMITPILVSFKQMTVEKILIQCVSEEIKGETRWGRGNSNKIYQIIFRTNQIII